MCLGKLTDSRLDIVVRCAPQRSSASVMRCTVNCQYALCVSLSRDYYHKVCCLSLWRVQVSCLSLLFSGTSSANQINYGSARAQKSRTHKSSKSQRTNRKQRHVNNLSLHLSLSHSSLCLPPLSVRVSLYVRAAWMSMNLWLSLRLRAFFWPIYKAPVRVSLSLTLPSPSFSLFLWLLKSIAIKAFLQLMRLFLFITFLAFFHWFDRRFFGSDHFSALPIAVCAWQGI